MELWTSSCRKGVHVCYKEPAPAENSGKKKSEDNQETKVRYTDSIKIENLRVDGGFVNIAGNIALFILKYRGM